MLSSFSLRSLRLSGIFLSFPLPSVASSLALFQALINTNPLATNTTPLSSAVSPSATVFSNFLVQCVSQKAGHGSSNGVMMSRFQRGQCRLNNWILFVLEYLKCLRGTHSIWFGNLRGLHQEISIEKLILGCHTCCKAS